ncbi:MAG TPA: hypothetical protein VGM84_02055 [Steroidobacteraceae bacterium]|jgi:hypothetical protein
MKRTTEQTLAGAQQAAAWVVDYGAARERAIRWLGDRHLLAKPINRDARHWTKVAPAVTELP